MIANIYFNIALKPHIPSRDYWNEKHSGLISDNCTLVYQDDSRMRENSGAGISLTAFSEVIYKDMPRFSRLQWDGLQLQPLNSLGRKDVCW